MKENKVNEMKDLIEVKQSIFKKLKKFFEDMFSGEKAVSKDIKILTFEEQLLSPEEREILKAKLEKDEEDAEYYKQVFENPEEFFMSQEEMEDYESDETEEESNTTVTTESKDDFFSKYERVKNGTENIDNLEIAELLKIEYLLREEISMRKTNMDSEEVAIIENELKALEEENRILTEELKKLEENN